MSVSGADDIDRALEKLSGLDMKQAVADAIQLVRSAAVNNCSVTNGHIYLRNMLDGKWEAWNLIK